VQLCELRPDHRTVHLPAVSHRQGLRPMQDGHVRLWRHHRMLGLQMRWEGWENTHFLWATQFIFSHIMYLYTFQNRSDSIIFRSGMDPAYPLHVSRNLILAFFRRKSTFLGINSCFFNFLTVFTTFLTCFGLKTGSWVKLWKVSQVWSNEQFNISKSHFGNFSPKINIFRPKFTFFQLFNDFYSLLGRFRDGNPPGARNFFISTPSIFWAFLAIFQCFSGP